MTLPGSHAPAPDHISEQRARDLTASLHAALRELPSRAWLSASTEAYENLAAAVDQVLGGSSRQEPALAASTLRQTGQMLTEAGHHIQRSVSELRQYSARIGGGGIDDNTPAWGAATPPQPPTKPEPTMASLAEFVRSVRSAISPESLTGAVDAVEKGRGQLGNAGGSMSTPDEIRSATAECSAASEKFRDAYACTARAQSALDEYVGTALGNAQAARENPATR